MPAPEIKHAPEPVRTRRLYLPAYDRTKPETANDARCIVAMRYKGSDGQIHNIDVVPGELFELSAEAAAALMRDPVMKEYLLKMKEPA